MFLDKVTIFCKAGNGGDGKVSFHRAKFVPNGGPDGGDGGDGGNIIFKATNKVSNLEAFRYKRSYLATDGEPGGSNNKFGKSGKDLIIVVPQGTVIKNAKNDKVLADMYNNDEEVVILKGGIGGRGNTHFATPTRQAPKYSELGVKTDKFEIKLELKTIADVGLVGFPNVGKSTLLASVSNARPKIANYHFTTLAPNIGVATANGSSFVMADIPGLISGASEGVGLGLDFLRHIERTRLLVHIVDISGSEGRDPINDYNVINNELKKYSDKVGNIAQIVALNKIDLLQDKSVVEKFKKAVPKGTEVFEISAAAHIGLNELLSAIVKKLETIPVPERIEVEQVAIDKKDRSYKIVKVCEGLYEVTGNLIDEITRRVVLEDYTSNAYFQKQIREEGIIDELKKKGLKDGDTVRLNGIELEYTE